MTSKQNFLLQTIVGLIAWLLISPQALANHRTGKLILPELVVAADLNKDGNLDLAVNCTGFDNVAILFGDGQGGFTLQGHFAVDTLPKGLQVGDVDRDGQLDLVTCNNWGYDQTVLLGDGHGYFHSASPPNEMDGDGAPVRLLLRDLNKDGRLDIATTAPQEKKLIIFFGDGKGRFPGPSEEVDVAADPFALNSADLNGDGNVDVVIIHTHPSDRPSQLSVLLGDGTGQFTTSTMDVPDSPTSVQVADLNGDGKQDLIVSGAQPMNTAGNFLATYLGDGTGQFVLQQELALGIGSSKGEIAVGDFNEDGVPDVAFPMSTLQIRGDPSTEVLIFFGDGAGNLTTGPVLNVGQEPHTVIAADFNKDGHLDLVDTDRGDGTVSCLVGDGHGNFTRTSVTSVLSANP